jgi:hypothetical protein
MTRTIKAIVCRVGEDARVEEMPVDFKQWQHFVRGCVQEVHLDNGVLLLCNEDGKPMGLPFNGYVPGRAPVPPPDIPVIHGVEGPPPGEFGAHRLRGNFALVRRGTGGNDYDPLTDLDVVMWLPVLLRRMAP